MHSIRSVIQLEPTGCGVAAVAAIAGVSYRKAQAVARSLGIRAADPTLWSDTAPVRRLLEAYGCTAGPREEPFRSWDALPDLALLAIKWHLVQGRPYWHWVVHVRENGHACVLDSKRALATHRRTDFGRMRPRWFIPVLARR